MSGYMDFIFQIHDGRLQRRRETSVKKNAHTVNWKPSCVLFISTKVDLHLN